MSTSPGDRVSCGAAGAGTAPSIEEFASRSRIEDVTISLHKGQEVVPLPEGSRYLGFIFSRADTPVEAEASLREAHRHLHFVIR